MVRSQHRAPARTWPDGYAPSSGARHLLCLISAVVLSASCDAVVDALRDSDPWPRSTIDASGDGADGVRPGDVNADGLADLVVPWEESGEVVVYVHPGAAAAALRWPRVRVGRVADVEDALFADLDGDGALDVVSSAEGDVRGIFVHWAPQDPAATLLETAWSAEELPAAAGLGQWLFSAAADIDGVNGPDLFAGSKGADAAVGWFASPADPRRLADWRWHRLADARWIMSLKPLDIDGDGDTDLVASERRGPRRGVWFYDNPGSEAAGLSTWTAQQVDDGAHEIMFIDVADLDQDGGLDIVSATAGRRLLVHLRTRQDPPAWSTSEIDLPDLLGTGKAVRVADMDGDGRRDIVVSCENADGRVGVAWLSQAGAVSDTDWNVHAISGLRGSKYDLVEVLDVDADGDLDVITTEEDAGLGVVWYANPRI